MRCWAARWARSRRGGDNADLNIEVVNHVFEVAGAVHLQTVDYFADLEGIAVKNAHNVEPAGAKLSVIQNGFAQVAHADEGHAPFTVHTEGGRDGPL